MADRQGRAREGSKMRVEREDQGRSSIAGSSIPNNIFYITELQVYCRMSDYRKEGGVSCRYSITVSCQGAVVWSAWERWLDTALH